MANSQDIEARLCDYIDGVLSDAERTEIERHLADHPQHRQMIQNLIRTATLVASLPHVSAPADLGEGLQGHLERSMLLGDGEPVAQAWRLDSGRVHKLAVVAALLLVMVGLGSGILLLLKASSHSNSLDAIAIAPLPASSANGPLSPAPTQSPPVEATIPDTQPSSQIVATPTTQPLAYAPTTQPDQSAEMSDVPFSSALADEPLGELADFVDSAPATQPALAAETPSTQPSADAPAAPATLPVADDAGEK